MCLAIPMRVTVVEGFAARCEARGVSREVSLFLLQHETVRPGYHVMVHGGEAIGKMTAEDAAATWQLLDQVLGSGDPPRDA